MTELAAAVIGALVGSFATLLWEGFLRPRQERRSIAAALNSEVAYNLLVLDRQLSRATSSEEHIPLDFAIATTVYGALASRLGDLPADLSFLLATHYSTVQEINSLPAHYAELDRIRRSGGQFDMNFAESEQKRLAHRFHELLRSAQAGCELLHVGLRKLAPGVALQIPGSALLTGDARS